MHFSGVQLGGLAPTPPIIYMYISSWLQFLFKLMAICTHAHVYTCIAQYSSTVYIGIAMAYPIL